MTPVTASAGSEGGVGALSSSLKRDGYVIFDPEVPDATIDAAIAEIDPLFRPEGRASRALRRAKRALRGRHTAISHRDEHRVQDAWVVSDNVKAIATAPAVVTVLREAYGREPLPFQTINFRAGSQQRPHSDAMHFNSEPSGFMCGIWLALEDIHEDSGPLVYYPGSHRLDEFTIGDVESATESPEHADYEDFIAALIEREGLEPRYATIRKGEALIWSGNLIHGGAPQTDPARSRWSQVTHYFFEGCRYWKPLASRNGERHYFEPGWVR
jgi:ectoine hydroxylase-related dioxygenase (phytanoyl-CoA dioxygenase family)